MLVSGAQITPNVPNTRPWVKSVNFVNYLSGDLMAPRPCPAQPVGSVGGLAVGQGGDPPEESPPGEGGEGAGPGGGALL